MGTDFPVATRERMVLETTDVALQSSLENNTYKRITTKLVNIFIAFPIKLDKARKYDYELKHIEIVRMEQVNSCSRKI